MGQKDLDHFVEKLRSMPPAVLEAVAQLFHTQHSLTQGGLDRAWLSPACKLPVFCAHTRTQFTKIHKAGFPENLRNYGFPPILGSVAHKFTNNVFTIKPYIADWWAFVLQAAARYTHLA